MSTFGEDKATATQNYLDRQSLDSAAKRTALVTLAMSLRTFNGKHLGDVKAAVAKIERFQAPLIQKMASVYNMFETVIMHILQDDDFLKNL